MPLAPLPIDGILPDLIAAVASGRNGVVQAEPGAGKTTRVPRALADQGVLGDGACWVLEPRRLAARMAAVRVAEEWQEPVGRRSGYAVRFEQRQSRATQVLFVTEGWFLKALQANPTLDGVTAVVLDEFHERHLATDVALALLRHLQQTRRPDLRLLVMSATLDAEPVARHLDAVVLKSEGRLFPVSVAHTPGVDDRPLADRVVAALTPWMASSAQGHALVFLPGASEIRQALSRLQPGAERHGFGLFPLHGSLDLETQRAAIAPSRDRKIILATNVAESSITVDGVGLVVDSGLGRESVFSRWSGLSSLQTCRISQARCLQRTGRAGRVGPGQCIRLFSESDFRARAAFDVPELHRTDWAAPLLDLHALGFRDIPGLPWLEDPPAASLECAEGLLRDLGALDAGGALTAEGRQMARLPVHPRLARLMVAGQGLGIPQLSARAAVLLELGELQSRQSLGGRSNRVVHALDCDLWPRLDAYAQAESRHFRPDALRALGLDAQQVHQARESLKSLAPSGETEPPDAEERLLQALLRAYPDRVARSNGRGALRLVGGGGALLDAASAVSRADLMLALEAEERVRGAGREVGVRLAARLEPEWLLEAFPEDIREWDELAFNPQTEAVERRSGLAYRDLVLDESRRRAEGGAPGVAACLAQALQEPARLARLSGLQAWLDRMLWASRWIPELQGLERTQLQQQVVETACDGLVSLRDLESVDWRWVVQATLGGPVLHRVEGLAPETVSLKQRRVKVQYDTDPPHIASRLQDFLGLREGPRIGGGAVPLVLHLLAPNQRAVQVTTDLAGFWQRAYRELRPALSRRYPKHAWPEQPEEG